MLNISNYTHEPLESIFCYDTFLITAYSAVKDSKEDVFTHLNTIMISEKDLYFNYSTLISAMVSAMEAMNVYDRKIAYVELKKSTLSDFIEYEINEKPTVFDGSLFKVKLTQEECKSQDNLVSCEEWVDAPENFFVSISRTPNGKIRYNNEKQQWKSKDKELLNSFIEDAMQEYDIDRLMFNFLTRRIDIKPSDPASLRNAERRLQQAEQKNPK